MTETKSKPARRGRPSKSSTKATKSKTSKTIKKEIEVKVDEASDSIQDTAQEVQTPVQEKPEIKKEKKQSIKVQTYTFHFYNWKNTKGKLSDYNYSLREGWNYMRLTEDLFDTTEKVLEDLKAKGFKYGSHTYLNTIIKEKA